MKKLTFFALIAVGACTFQACNNSGGGDKNEQANAVTDSSQNPSHDSIDNSNNVINETAVKGDSHMFMEKAASSGMLEVEGGKLAQAKGQSQRVKSFGAMMVRDHTKANTELKALAANKHVTLPAGLSAEDQAHLDAMKKLSGADFDKHYIKMMAEGHTKVADMFQKESTDETDADVKNFAAKTLPVIRMHLDSARAINSSINKM